MSEPRPTTLDPAPPGSDGVPTPVLTESLRLDRRARAMLKAMGIQWFWPNSSEAAPAQRADVPAPIAPAAAQSVSQTPADASPIAGVSRPSVAPAPEPETAPPAAVEQLLRPAVSVFNTLWDELPASIDACQVCKLCEGSTARVAGWGSSSAKWLFVVESLAPSDQGQQPVNGDEWELLQAMWRAMKLTPDDVYLTSLTKCRPLPGVLGGPTEAKACVAYVQRQIALLQPHMVVAMGQPVAQALLAQSAQQFAALGQWRSQLHSYRPADHAATPVAVTYPLASLLRNPIDKGKVWADLCMAMVHVQASATVRVPGSGQ
ncbi:uracil-DNA glycosylase [Comamonadaceae bacterium M7527]|nr:uracil-DNA glycosylase [Comamonadaceae bacterium M7527]